MYDKWIDMLLGIDLFKEIEKEELTKILRCSNPSIKHYKKKELITIEKSQFTGIGVLLEGEVTLAKETIAGDRLIISRIGPGNTFGEISAFVNQKWLETATAKTNCQVLFISPDRIIGMCPHMCNGHRVLVQNTLQIVSKKAFELHKKVELLSLKSIREKISTYLLERYYINETLTFEITHTRNELADYLNIQRPSLSRELSNMKDEGIIEFNRNNFKVLDLELLKDCL